MLSLASISTGVTTQDELLIAVVRAICGKPRSLLGGVAVVACSGHDAGQLGAEPAALALACQHAGPAAGHKQHARPRLPQPGGGLFGGELFGTEQRPPESLGGTRRL